jgi:hypothetical protein
VNTLYRLEEWRDEQRISPPGDNFTPRGQLRPWGQSLPLVAKLRMGLRTHPEDTVVMNILRQRTHDIEVKKFCVDALDKLGSFAYTIQVLSIFVAFRFLSLHHSGFVDFITL